MRKPRPEDYDPNYKKGPKPDDIDLMGVIPLKKRETNSEAKNKWLAESKESQTKIANNNEKVTPSDRDTMPPSNHATMVASNHDTMTYSICAALKDFGKEAATHRFTVGEKAQLSEILFAHRKKGVRTNENEVTRIAINFVIADFKNKGDESILSKVLRVLNE